MYRLCLEEGRVGSGAGRRQSVRAQEGFTHSRAAFRAPRGRPQALCRNAAMPRWALLALSVLTLTGVGAGAAAAEPSQVVVRAPA